MQCQAAPSERLYILVLFLIPLLPRQFTLVQFSPLQADNVAYKLVHIAVLIIRIVMSLRNKFIPQNVWVFESGRAIGACTPLSIQPYHFS